MRNILMISAITLAFAVAGGVQSANASSTFDWDINWSGSPLQSGYSEYDTSTEQDVISPTYTDPFGTGLDLTIQLDLYSNDSSTNVTWADQNVITGTTLSDLLRDFAAPRFFKQVELQLQNLPAGEFELTTHHHNGGGAGEEDAAVKVNGVADGTVKSSDKNSSFFGSYTTTFTVANDGDDVIILFDENSAADTIFPLNGLNLTYTATVIPEPASAALLIFGGAIMLRRRSRNQA